MINGLSSVYNSFGGMVLNKIFRGDSQEPEQKNTAAASDKVTIGVRGASQAERLANSLGFPDWVANICYAGTTSQETNGSRSELIERALGYFQEVKDEFGCDDDSYLPYSQGLPEYDRKTAEAMKQAFNGKLENDPRAEELLARVGGLWPPSANTGDLPLMV